jgi:hypothetical protein
MSENYWLSLKYMSSGVPADTRVFTGILTLFWFVPPILSLSIKSRRVLSARTFHFRSKRPGTPRAAVDALEYRHTSCCCSEQNLNLSAAKPVVYSEHCPTVPTLFHRLLYLTVCVALAWNWLHRVVRHSGAALYSHSGCIRAKTWQAIGCLH